MTKSTTLHECIEQNDLNQFRFLLAQTTTDPNCRNNLNQTPLHVAARENKIDFVNALIAHPDTDLNARTPDKKKTDDDDPEYTYTELGQAALQFANTADHKEVVKALLFAGSTIPSSLSKNMSYCQGIIPGIFASAIGAFAASISTHESIDDALKDFMQYICAQFWGNPFSVSSLTQPFIIELKKYTSELSLEKSENKIAVHLSQIRAEHVESVLKYFEDIPELALDTDRILRVSSAFRKMNDAARAMTSLAPRDDDLVDALITHERTRQADIADKEASFEAAAGAILACNPTAQEYRMLAYILGLDEIEGLQAQQQVPAITTKEAPESPPTAPVTPPPPSTVFPPNTPTLMRLKANPVGLGGISPATEGGLGSIATPTTKRTGVFRASTLSKDKS